MELLTSHEGELLVRIARSAVDWAVAKTPKPKIHHFPVLEEKRGVFVTLTKGGALRGCIGFPYPVMPLGDAIVHAAGAAALEDFRFPPVKKEELDTIHIEITVLTVPVVVESDPEQRPENVVVGKHGLIIRGRGTSGLLLPQVATDYGWDATAFLDNTCTKAGLSAKCWKSESIELLTFEGQIFSEQR